jgi:hypothetical protein
MVNRFLRKYRLDTVTAFTSPEALAALDFINEAKEEILDTHRWSFDEREGVINTIAFYEDAGTTGGWNNGSPVVVSATAVTDTFVGDYTLRAVPTDSTDRGQTAHRVESVTIAGPIISYTLAESFSGADVASNSDLFASEYQFPYHSNNDTQVRALLSMTHQERPLRLEEVDKNFRFDSLIGRYHDSIGSDPEVVYYGKPVYDTVAFGGTPVLRPGFMVWPIPSASERLDYTYRYAHPPLEAVTDTMAEVPETVIRLISDLAYGFSLNTKFGNDPGMASKVIPMALTRIERLKDSDKKTPFRRKPVRSLDNLSGAHQHGRRISNDLITGY